MLGSILHSAKSIDWVVHCKQAPNWSTNIIVTSGSDFGSLTHTYNAIHCNPVCWQTNDHQWVDRIIHSTTSEWICNILSWCLPSLTRADISLRLTVHYFVLTYPGLYVHMFKKNKLRSGSVMLVKLGIPHGWCPAFCDRIEVWLAKLKWNLIVMNYYCPQLWLILVKLLGRSIPSWIFKFVPLCAYVRLWQAYF